MNVLCTENLKKYYGINTKITKAVDGISFNIDEGEFVANMGASGSGKTTLLNCISTIDTVSSGHIYLENQDITEIKEENIAKFRRENLGFIFQDFNLLDTMTIEENIALSLIINKEDVKEIDKKVVTIATKLGISDILKKFPYEVSGGQKQRVAIVRALCMNPEIMLFDEVTASLDPEMVKEVLEVILELANEGMTMLIVTHEMRFAQKVADRICFFDEGKLIEESTPQEFFSAPKSQRAQKFLNVFEL